MMGAGFVICLITPGTRTNVEKLKQSTALETSTLSINGIAITQPIRLVTHRDLQDQVPVPVGNIH